MTWPQVIIRRHGQFNLRRDAPTGVSVFTVILFPKLNIHNSHRTTRLPRCDTVIHVLIQSMIYVSYFQLPRFMEYRVVGTDCVTTLRPTQNGHHFAEDISKFFVRKLLYLFPGSNLQYACTGSDNDLNMNGIESHHLNQRLVSFLMSTCTGRPPCVMITSSSDNIFNVTGPLRGEFTGHRWIPFTKASDGSFDVFVDLRLNKPLGKQSWDWSFETPSRLLCRHCNGKSFFRVQPRSRAVDMKSRITSFISIWLTTPGNRCFMVLYEILNGGRGNIQSSNCAKLPFRCHIFAY